MCWRNIRRHASLGLHLHWPHLSHSAGTGSQQGVWVFRQEKVPGSTGAQLPAAGGPAEHWPPCCAEPAASWPCTTESLLFRHAHGLGDDSHAALRSSASVVMSPQNAQIFYAISGSPDDGLGASLCNLPCMLVQQWVDTQHCWLQTDTANQCNHHGQTAQEASSQNQGNQHGAIGQPGPKHDISKMHCGIDAASAAANHQLIYPFNKINSRFTS